MSNRPPFREEMFSRLNIMSRIWMRYFQKISDDIVNTEDITEISSLNSLSQMQEKIKKLQDTIFINDVSKSQIQELLQKVQDFIAIKELAANNFQSQIQSLQDLTATSAIANISTTNAAGSNGEVQFNKQGILGADTEFSWDSTSKILTINGTINIPLDNVGITFGADAPNALIYFDSVHQRLLIDVFADDESPADVRIESGLSAGGGINLDNNSAIDWGEDKEGWLQASDGSGFFISSKNGDLTFRTGVNGTTNRLIIEADGDLIFNPSYNDDDFTIKKETAGIAYMYDAGDDDHCFGDGGTTDYSKFASKGQYTLHGDARVKRHVRISAASWKPGATAPTESRLSVFPTLIFAVNDDAHFSLICPFRLAAGTVINVLVDFTHRDAADTGTAEWTLEYNNVAVGESVTGATSTISGISGATAQHDLTRVQLTTGIVGAVEHDAIGLILSHTNGGTIGVNVDLIDVHFEFIMDKLGEAI